MSGKQVKTIIGHEILEKIKSLQFVALIVMSIILFTMNGLQFMNRYNVENAEYQDRVTMNQGNPSSIYTLPGYVSWNYDQPFDTKGGPNYPRPSTVATDIFKHPNPFLFLAEGGTKHSTGGYTVRPGVIQDLYIASGNYKMPEFPEIDWVFIIKTVFCLYAILLSYDAISGEKEQGTLKLMLSNALPRSKLLLAKYCSIMILLMIPFFIGSLISTIIMITSVPVIITKGLLFRFFLIFCSVVFLLSLFTGIGLLISTRIHKSSLGLFVLFTIWIFFYIFPHITGIIVNSVIKGPGEVQFMKQKERIVEKHRAIMHNNFVDESSPDFKGYINSGEEIKEKIFPYIGEAHKEILKTQRAYENALLRRKKLLSAISRISPLELLQHFSETIAESGIQNEERFMNDAMNFSQIYDTYVYNKTGELQVLTSELIQGVRRNTNGYYGVTNPPEHKEYEGDKSDFPGFTERMQTKKQLFQNSIIDVFGLLLWNIVLLFGIITAFNRADVR